MFMLVKKNKNLMKKKHSDLAKYAYTKSSK